MRVEPGLSGAGAVVAASGVDLEHLYREMVWIRLVEDAVHRPFLEGHKPGTTLYQRQETVAVGVRGGRAESMNIVDLDRGVLSCFGILVLPTPERVVLAARERLGEPVASPQARV